MLPHLLKIPTWLFILNIYPWVAFALGILARVGCGPGFSAQAGPASGASHILSGFAMPGAGGTAGSFCFHHFGVAPNFEGCNFRFQAILQTFDWGKVASALGILARVACGPGYRASMFFVRLYIQV